ncbi:hypothetical protein [Sphingomonas adhaesiva]|uniref:hypothetical protein n=1 Tax=Sphingomonas adhaesiva TaxID=28212 RepID=UPI002FF5BE03
MIVPTATAQTPICARDGDPDSTQAVSDGRQLSEIIAVDTCWKADTENGKHQYLNDLYGRWVVEQEPPVTRANLVRSYQSEKRGAIARFFVGKSNGAVVTVKLKLRDPDVEFTVPLLSVNYNGKSGEGQAFITNITTSDMGLPDFRLSPNTSVTVEASARTTDEVDVQSAGVVLAAVKDSLSIAAPAGSLLTSVNREQVQRVAAAYDSALSKLLSTTISESMSASRVLSEWYPGASFLVAVDVPRSIRTINDRGDKGKSTGQRTMYFRIRMACPRLSVFDTVSACESGSTNLRALINSPYRDPGNSARQVQGEPGFTGTTYQKIAADLAGRINPNQVLAFRVGVGKTLRQFLTEQEWFLMLSKKMVDLPAEQKVVADAAVAEGALKATKEEKKTLTASIVAADEFCQAVVDKLFSAGLSHLDAQIGLWALATGVPDFAASRSVFQGAPRCTEQLPGAGWSFSTDA